MSFFESLLVLLLAAVLLLQLARRASLPYPAMLALAGVGVAFIPGAPNIGIDPETALALFIAPILLDAGYDFPVKAASALWRPLLVLAAGAVLATAAVVAWIGWSVAGLPIMAALVLGAIVAPPDAAATVAVLGTVSLPRRTIGVLKGESLFNDATALLLFNGALAVQMSGGLDGNMALRLAVAVPGGIALGIAFGVAFQRIARFVGNTLGANLLQFLNAFLVWLIAERLGLSAVLAVVACAMTVARSAERTTSPRMRVHSFAVWASVVFLLNVLAFLLMGMQARTIVGGLSSGRLVEAARFTSLVVLGVIVTRFAVVMIWNRAATYFARVRGDLAPPTVQQGVVVAWAGMRGLVTLATAFALPPNFPQRDLVVLAAFGVVLATLALQGLTLAPLIRLLRLDQAEEPDADVAAARGALAKVGLDRIGSMDAADDLTLAELFRLKGQATSTAAAGRLERYRQLGLAAVAAQRTELQKLRDTQQIDMSGYYLLQEEIDWRELTLLPESERQIEEG
jgi:monovalent cation/hydrogen antiporter